MKSSASEILDELGTTLYEVEASHTRVEQIKATKKRIESFREIITTLDMGNATVHRFQRIDEAPTSPLDDSDIEWVITGMEGGEVVLKSPPSWDSQRFSVDEFRSELESDALTPKKVDGNTPEFGY